MYEGRSSNRLRLCWLKRTSSNIKGADEMQRKQAFSSCTPHSWRSGRSVALMLTMIVLGGGTMVGGTVSALANRGGHDAVANAAKIIKVHESVNATNESHKGGSVINDRGRGTGTFNCPVVMEVRVSYTKGTTELTCFLGSSIVKAGGSASFFSAGSIATFTGTMTVHGTGKYAHAHGQLQVEGTMQRKTFALEASVTGTISD
jgi:hypothetical protein